MSEQKEALERQMAIIRRNLRAAPVSVSVDLSLDEVSVSPLPDLADAENKSDIVAAAGVNHSMHKHSGGHQRTDSATSQLSTHTMRRFDSHLSAYRDTMSDLSSVPNSAHVSRQSTMRSRKSVSRAAPSVSPEPVRSSSHESVRSLADVHVQVSSLMLTQNSMRGLVVRAVVDRRVTEDTASYAQRDPSWRGEPKEDSCAVARDTCKSLLPNLMAGCISALTGVFRAVSLSTLLFQGPLEPYVDVGVKHVLIGYAVTQLLMQYFSEFTVHVCASSFEMAPFMLAAFRQVVSRMERDGDSPQRMVSTVLAMAVLCNVFAASLQLLLGSIRSIARLPSFFPPSVQHGIFASLGWSLLGLTYKITADTRLTPSTASVVFSSENAIHSIMATVIGVAMFAAMVKWRSAATIPLYLSVVTASYHGAFWYMSWSVEEAREKGYLVKEPEAGDYTRLYTALDPRAVAWQQLISLDIITNLAMAAIMGPTLNVVLNLSVIGPVVEQQVNMLTELKAHGWSMLAGALSGGWPAYLGVSLVELHKRSGGTRTYSCVLISAILLFVVFYAKAILLVGMLPRALLGSVFAYSGFNFLYNSLWRARASLQRQEIALVWVLLLLAIATGDLSFTLLIGLAFGFFFFVAHASVVPLVGNTRYGTQLVSSVKRSVADMVLLEVVARRIVVLPFRGILFFANVALAAQELQQRVRAHPEASFLVIDMSSLHSIDAEALKVLQGALVSAQALTRRLGTMAHLLLVQSHTRAVRMQTRTLFNAEFWSFRGDEINSAVAWCENKLLQSVWVRQGLSPRVYTPPQDTCASFRDKFRMLLRLALVHRVPTDICGQRVPWVWTFAMRKAFSLHTYRTGELVWSTKQDGVYFLAEGCVGASDGSWISYGHSIMLTHGSTWSQQNNIACVALVPCKVLHITKKQFQRLWRAEPAATLEFMRVAAHSLHMQQARLARSLSVAQNYNASQDEQWEEEEPDQEETSGSANGAADAKLKAQMGPSVSKSSSRPALSRRSSQMLQAEKYF